MESWTRPGDVFRTRVCSQVGARDAVAARAVRESEREASRRPMRKSTLEVSLCVPCGREVEAARLLARTLPEEEWKILAALAAELLHEHELRTGATVVLVAGAPQAERVLRDLQKE